MLTSPQKAADSSKNLLFEKLVALTVAVLTVLILNDILAIFVHKIGYRIVVTLFLDLFGIAVLFCYVRLYCLFIPLVRDSFKFMRC